MGLWWNWELVRSAAPYWVRFDLFMGVSITDALNSQARPAICQCSLCYNDEPSPRYWAAPSCTTICSHTHRSNGVRAPARPLTVPNVRLTSHSSGIHWSVLLPSCKSYRNRYVSTFRLPALTSPVSSRRMDLSSDIPHSIYSFSAWHCIRIINVPPVNSRLMAICSRFSSQ